MRFTWSRVESARAVPGRAVLLLLTGRCPVGCAHCSVSATPDADTDLASLAEMVRGIAASGVEIVGISGGEPFVSRRALTGAVEVLGAHRKHIVLYTSGVWASAPEPAPWIRRVLAAASCVVIGTDRFHRPAVPADRVTAALMAVRAAGARPVLQVLEDEGVAGAALLAAAFGGSWTAHADLATAPLLPYGRGAGLATRAPERPGGGFGRCPVAAAPVVRADGQISGCCNEAVATGGGPRQLRRAAEDAAGVTAALADLATAPYLAAVRTAGLGALTRLPGCTDLAARPFTHPCLLCWQLAQRTDTAPGRAMLRLLTAAAPAGALGPAGSSASAGAPAPVGASAPAGSSAPAGASASAGTAAALDGVS